MRPCNAEPTNVVAFPCKPQQRSYSLNVLTEDVESTMILIEACIPRSALLPILALLNQS